MHDPVDAMRAALLKVVGPYPDVADQEQLQSAVESDAIFIQFYNNYCGVLSYVAGVTGQPNFDFAAWDVWARTISGNKDVKILLGGAAGPTAAGRGYMADPM